MPRVRFRTDGRTPGVSRSGWLDFTWHELLSAAISVGRLWDPYRRTGSPPATAQSLLLFDAMHRAGSIAAYLSDQGGRIAKSSLFDQLDRSEKMIASYFTGMAMAKVFSSHQLGVHQLVHLDRFSHPAVAVPPAGPRPDLIAWDRSALRWVVVEAKGRSGGKAAEPLAKMAAQKSTVNLGGAAAIRVATLSYYRQPGTPLVADDQLHLEVVDPPETINLDVTEDQAAWCYYRPLVELVTAWDQAEQGTQVVQAVDIPTADAQFGLHEALVDSVPAEPVDGLADLLSGVLEDLQPGEVGGGRLLRDGTWVQLGASWPRRSSELKPARES